MESFKYNVFESKSLFSEFYHSRHVFFTRVPHFNALPGMFPTLYSSIIIIQLNTNIAIGERYSKFFIDLFILELLRRPFSV
jgi:hypothetical protein